jgi:RNA polymerase sigma-70 factor, ECF subfamily
MIGRRFPHVLKAAAGGDEAAFGVLWHDLQPRLLRYFTVMVPTAAEELAAATWMAVIGGLSRFRGSEPAFRAWVFTIARHQLGGWQRQSGGNPAEQRPVTNSIERAAFDDPVTPSKAFRPGPLSTWSRPCPPTRPRPLPFGWWPG